jgi:hypothetical protein
VENIGVAAAADGVVAIGTKNRVVAAVAVDVGILKSAVDDVIARAAIDRVKAGGDDDIVSAVPVDEF